MPDREPAARGLLGCAQLPQRGGLSPPIPAIAVRQLAPEEWPLFRDIRLEALRTDPAEFGAEASHELAFDSSTWQQRLRWMYFVFPRYGGDSTDGAGNPPSPSPEKPVGMLGVLPETVLSPTGSPGIGVIASVWTHPAARRRGVMEAALACVLREHNGADCHRYHQWGGRRAEPRPEGGEGAASKVGKFRLEITKGNAKALALYRKLGFEVEAGVHLSCCCDLALCRKA
ncbi:hypothetical protein DIPPA_15481 [Diplonema papillatum]|nr:hypothetical protein DIPPA_15481 [Diplonema papillatum]